MLRAALLASMLCPGTALAAETVGTQPPAAATQEQGRRAERGCVIARPGLKVEEGARICGRKPPRTGAQYALPAPLPPTPPK